MRNETCVLMYDIRERPSRYTIFTNPGMYIVQRDDDHHGKRDCQFLNINIFLKCLLIRNVHFLLINNSRHMIFIARFFRVSLTSSSETDAINVYVCFNLITQTDQLIMNFPCINDDHFYLLPSNGVQFEKKPIRTNFVAEHLFYFIFNLFLNLNPIVNTYIYSNL